MAGANYMGGRRNAAKARVKDANGRLQRSHFGKQRLEILSKGLTKPLIPTRSTQPSGGGSHVADIGLAHARKAMGMEPQMEAKETMWMDNRTIGNTQSPSIHRRRPRGRDDLVVHDGSSSSVSTKSGSNKRSSRILRELITSEPISMRAEIDRMLELPDFVGLSQPRKDHRMYHSVDMCPAPSRLRQLEPEHCLPRAPQTPARQKLSGDAVLERLSSESWGRSSASHPKLWDRTQFPPQSAKWQSADSYPLSPSRNASEVIYSPESRQIIAGDGLFYTTGDFEPMQFDDSSGLDCSADGIRDYDTYTTGRLDYDDTDSTGFYRQHYSEMEQQETSSQGHSSPALTFSHQAPMALAQRSDYSCSVEHSPLERSIDWSSSPPSGVSLVEPRGSVSGSWDLPSPSHLELLPPLYVPNRSWPGDVDVEEVGDTHHSCSSSVCGVESTLIPRTDNSSPCANSLTGVRTTFVSDLVAGKYLSLRGMLPYSPTCPPLESCSPSIFGAPMEETLGSVLQDQLFEIANPWKAVKIYLDLYAGQAISETSATDESLERLLPLLNNRTGVGYTAPVSPASNQSSPIVKTCSTASGVETGSSMREEDTELNMMDRTSAVSDALQSPQASTGSLAQDMEITTPTLMRPSPDRRASSGFDLPGHGNRADRYSPDLHAEESESIPVVPRRSPSPRSPPPEEAIPVPDCTTLVAAAGQEEMIVVKDLSPPPSTTIQELGRIAGPCLFFDSAETPEEDD